MAKSTDDLVNEIIFFEPADDDFTELEALVDDLRQAGGASAALPALLTLFERFADAEGNAFDAAARLIEQLGGGYESQVLSSFRRSPSLTTARMLGRLLDRGVSTVDGDALLEAFEEVSQQRGLPDALAQHLAPYRPVRAEVRKSVVSDDDWAVSPTSERGIVPEDFGADSASGAEAEYDEYATEPASAGATNDGEGATFAEEMDESWPMPNVVVVEQTTAVAQPMGAEAPTVVMRKPAAAKKKPAEKAPAPPKKPAVKKPAPAAKKPAPAAKKPAPAAKKPAAKKPAPAARKPAAKKAAPAAKKPAAKKPAAKKPAAKKPAAKKPTAKKPAAKKAAPAAKKPAANKPAAKKPAPKKKR